ncbi:MAG: TSUP family transporter [Pseudomonadales bacterium]
MDFITLLELALIIAAGTYIQTVTGFGLGMVVMGVVTMFGLLPIVFTSVVISLTTLSNGVFALRGDHEALDRKAMLYTSIGMLPAIALGLFLLQYMDAQFNNLLQFLLGVVIIVGGACSVLKPEPLARVSKPYTFSIAGAAGGFLAGMFSVAGPPLVYQFYRQPFEMRTIRICLITAFLVSSVIRTAMLGVQGALELNMFTFALFCIPVVYTATWLGRNYPPKLSQQNMRRLAIAMLICIGTSLVVKTAGGVFG